MSTFDRAFILLLDGARPDMLRELAAAGELPHVQRRFIDGGTAADAVSVFPSTTGPAHLPYLTGMFPGPCDVPGIRWFDRRCYGRHWFSLSRFRSYMGVGSLFIGRDLRREVRTLFQEISDHALVGGTIHRGCGRWRNRTRFGRILAAVRSFFAEDWFVIDRLSRRHLLAAAADGTRFTFAAFYSIDAQAHKRGVRSPEVLAAYRRLDGVIGDLFDVLERRGEAQRTLVAVVSDHGASDTHTHVDLAALVERAVGRTFIHPLIHRYYLSARSAVMVSGNSMAHVYVKDPAGWDEPGTLDDPSPDLARLTEALLADPGVDVIMGRSRRGGVCVRSRRGAARLRLEGDAVDYAVDGADPFGYGPLPARMTRLEAITRTADTEYPDGPVQAAQLFESGRTGDIVVSARPGFDLRLGYEKPPHLGSHGSLHRDHMLVPLFVNHPLSPGPFRSVDVHPMVLAGLGLPVPPGIDGRTITAG